MKALKFVVRFIIAPVVRLLLVLLVMLTIMVMLATAILFGEDAAEAVGDKVEGLATSLAPWWK